LAPLTGETESGLLPTPTSEGGKNGMDRKLFPTPAATYYGSNQGGSAGRTGPVRLGLETMARKGLWPTPTASMMTMGDLNQARFAGNKGGNRPTYEDAKLWPTPTVGDSRSSGSRNTANSKAHPGVSLTDAVRGDAGTGRMEFATPKASDSKGGVPQDSKGKRDLRLDAKKWATPNTVDSKGGTRTGKGQVQLCHQVKWPTPTTHDHKGFENTRQSRSVTSVVA